MAFPTPHPFKIAVEESLYSFIQQRVATGRIPQGFDFPPGKEWTYGVPPAEMARLKEYWITKYDWRAVEARINSHLKMFTLSIEHGGETFTMHFVHHRSENEGAVPILFQHGWPGSFLEVSGMSNNFPQIHRHELNILRRWRKS
jgi:Epoxide hydrolase N terminus